MLAAAALAAIATVVVTRTSSRTTAATPGREPITVIAPPKMPVPAVPARSDEQRVRALEEETAAQAALISNAADHVIPAPFPTDLPDAQRELGFRAVLDDAIRTCMRGATLAALSCDEPPCIALIGVGAPSETPPAVYDCTAWKRVYGRTLGAGGFNTVECGNGHQEMVQVISPDLESWAGWHALDDDTKRHIEARYSARLTRLLAEYACSSNT